MGRKAMIGWVVVAVALVLMTLESPGEAALGCFHDGDFSAATCDSVADCAPVGGTDCTFAGAFFCACATGPNNPFCPCAAIPAPALSQRSMLGAAALVCAIGLLGLWRHAARTRRDLA